MTKLNSDLSIIWSASAKQSLLETIERIEKEDPGTAHLVLSRIENSLRLLTSHPGLGTFTSSPGVRRYAIPHTGHTLNYRVVSSELRILRWYRQRQRIQT